MASITQTTRTFSTLQLLSLLGWTARLRFSIHLSRSAAERQEKHLVPVDVVTWWMEAEEPGHCPHTLLPGSSCSLFCSPGSVLILIQQLSRDETEDQTSDGSLSGNTCFRKGTTPDVLQRRPGGHTSRRKREDRGQGDVWEVEELKMRSRSLQVTERRSRNPSTTCVKRSHIWRRRLLM